MQVLCDFRVHSDQQIGKSSRQMTTGLSFSLTYQ